MTSHRNFVLPSTPTKMSQEIQLEKVVEESQKLQREAKENSKVTWTFGHNFQKCTQKECFLKIHIFLKYVAYPWLRFVCFLWNILIIIIFTHHHVLDWWWSVVWFSSPFSSSGPSPSSLRSSASFSALTLYTCIIILKIIQLKTEAQFFHFS